MYIILSLYAVGGFIFWFFLAFFHRKLLILEHKIIQSFEKRTNLVPALYEATLPYLNKHEEVFYQILNLRKNEFFQNEETFVQKMQNEMLIHHELNFIFKVSNKHPKIQKNEKFLLIRDLFLENSEDIGEKINVYKIGVEKFNFFMKYKNFFIICWLSTLQPKSNI